MFAWALALALLCFAAPVGAQMLQTIFAGTSTAGGPGCATNFVADQSDGCNAVLFAFMRY
jgi:hypothetical protein